MSLAVAAGSGGNIVAGATPSVFSAFTLCGMCLVISDVATGINVRQIIVAMCDIDMVDDPVFLDWDGNNTNTMLIGSYQPPNYAEATFASRPAVGEWFHFYVRCSGAGTAQLEAGWAKPTDAAYVTAASDMFIGTLIPHVLRYARYTFTSDSNMRFSHLRAWNSKLTDAEIALERWSDRAVKLPVVFDVPADGPTTTLAALDYSGAAANLTLTTTTIADNAPISDLLAEIEAFNDAASGVINTVTLTDSILPSDAMSWSAIRVQFQFDVMVFNDLILQQATKTIQATDAMLLSDDTVVSRVLNRLLEDFNALVDETLRLYRLTIQTSDTVVLIDDLIASSSSIRIVTAILESLAVLSDSLQTMMQLTRAGSSTINVSDEIVKFAIFNRDIVDAIQVADSFLRQMQLTIVLTDAATLIDSLVALLVTITLLDGSLIAIGANVPFIRLGMDPSLIQIGGDRS